MKKKELFTTQNPRRTKSRIKMKLNFSDYEIEKARQVLSKHIPEDITKESALELLLFCIASQAMRWELASDFVKSLRQKSFGKYSSWEILINKNLVHETSKEKGYRFHHERRFDCAIDYFQNNDFNSEEIMNANIKTRREYCEQIKFLGNKTFSFWHLCLGGKNLLALDVHVLRGLNKLGIDMDEYYFASKPRGKGNQKVRKTPNEKDYLRIEDDARNLFSEDERFFISNGKVDMALVDALLWWKGASRNGTMQLYLPGEDFQEFSYLPY